MSEPKRVDKALLERSLAPEQGASSAGQTSSVDQQIDTGCELCSGLGWVVNVLPVRHPLFGQARECECLQPYLDAQSPDYLRDLTRFKMPAWMTVAAWEYRPELATEEVTLRQWAEGNLEDRCLMAMYGGSGTGKTHWGVAIVRAWQERGLHAKWITAVDLSEEIRQIERGFGDENDTAKLWQRRYSLFPLLVIDDYGVQRDTALAGEQLDNLIGLRYNLLKPTILTTNLGELPIRIADRVRDHRLSLVLRFNVASHRSGEKW